MTLGLTQPLTEMSTRSMSWGGKCGRFLGLTDCLEIWDSLNLVEPSGPVQNCNGIALPLPNLT